MIRRLALVAGAGFALAAPGALLMPGGGALAQSNDPAALRLIERLRPPAGGVGQTRGIRVPGAADSGAAAAQPVAPAASGAPVGSPPPPSAAGRAAAAVPPPRETTAPAGVPAASITVNFATGAWTITPQAERALAPLGRALTSPDLAPYRFRIEGHTDTVGDPAMNQTLSERRAAAVRDHLIQRYGVDPARLDAVGFGEAQLLVPTPDQAPEAKNRRVQVLNLGG